MCYYTLLQSSSSVSSIRRWFSTRETADNLEEVRAFVPGIRPGEQTTKYIDKVLTRLTLIGALYITFICLIPSSCVTQ